MKIIILILNTMIFASDVDHLLLTQIVTQPDNAESISIHNPTNQIINLQNYYICDNNEYYLITENTFNSHAASGYTARFPNMNIEPGETLIIALNENYQDFYGNDFIPDLTLFGSNENSLSGQIGFSNGKIHKTSEMVILFHWDGMSDIIQDVDYFSWSTLNVNQKGLDKSGISNYNNDTSIENQLHFNQEAEEYYAYSRINVEEMEETYTGGNGITGHDETSENFRNSWEIIELFDLGCMTVSAINYDPTAIINDGSCYFTTIQEIISNPIIGDEVITAGIITDYINLVEHGGPHIIKVSENLSGLTLEIKIWDNNWSNEYQELIEKYPFYTHQLKIIGMVAEWDGELQIEPTSIKVINENYEFQSNEVSISSILQGNHDGIIITFSGIITDYINLIEHEGPHIIKISEDINKSSLEIAIWDDGWTSFHQELITKCPFYTHELKVTGMVDRYEGEIQINGSSIQIINENHEFQPTIESISSVYQGNHNNKIITCKGLLVDYFDITKYDGPHSLTLENEQGYRIELSIWPDIYDITNSPYSYLLDPPYGQYYISATGNVGEYKNKKQLSILCENFITILDTINTTGNKYEGLMASISFDYDFDNFNDDLKNLIINDFATQLNISSSRIKIISIKSGSLILDFNILEKSENTNEPSNDNLIGSITNMTAINGINVSINNISQLSNNSVKITPAPFVIIPTLDERLDYSFSFPSKSRVIIRIFDISGKFITSLLDEYYEEAATIMRDEYHSSWNGKDQLGQIVSPGTYIMYIEAMNPLTGKTYTDSAPIVVGVKN